MNICHSTEIKLCLNPPRKLKLTSNLRYQWDLSIYTESVCLVFRTWKPFSRKTCFVFLDKLSEESKSFYHFSATAKRATYSRNSKFQGTLISNRMNFLFFNRHSRKSFSDGTQNFLQVKVFQPFGIIFSCIYVVYNSHELFLLLLKLKIL